jgi:UDP-N-acetylglucosamine 3-dehydrogenase
MANLRAGLIGLGMMGRHHARVLASLEGVDLVAVADPGGDKFSVAGGRPVHETIEQLIAEKLDYCMVAVPTQYHAEIAKALAEAGVHAMIEKPLAGSSSEATEIAKAFEAAGLVGAVGHIERYNPALQALRVRLEAGELGDIYQITTRRQGPFPARIADVGVVLDLATHDIDLTAWVTQSPFVTVAAQSAHKSGRQYEDLIAVTGKLADGTVTSHLVNWLSPMKERLTVVTGEKGAFIADTLTADLTFHANGTVVTAWDDVAHFRGVSEGDMVR